MRWATVAFVIFCVGSANLPAQTNPCTSQSSFQFPLWNDGVKWTLPTNYSSIQLADIDGDGQDELLGYGPFGIEVWHWDPSGEAWMQMPAGTPKFGPNDLLMAADINGDGQAEIIQVTNAQSASQSVTVAVWQYDALAQVWQLQPNLQLSLPASVDINNNVLSPMIQFADLNKSGKKELVYLQSLSNGSQEFAAGQIFKVNANGTNWKIIGAAPLTPLPTPTVGGPFKIADVTTPSYGITGDGLPDIVLKTAAGFEVWVQTPTTGGVSFAPGQYSYLPNNQPPVGNFGFVYEAYNNVQAIVAIPASGSITPYFYNPVVLTPQISFATSTQSFDPSQFGSLFTAVTGLNPSDPTATSVLILGADGLDEYGVVTNQGFTKFSNTPFISKTRFGDDTSHYTTIQAGTVRYGVNGALKPILIARDASSMHTLIRSTNVCESGVAGFALPQAKYFPAFVGGQAAAYSYISNALVTGNFNIRSLYPNNYASLPSYEATLAALDYPAATPNLAFTQNDFNAVKTQLNTEFLAAGNTVSYFTAGNAQINNLFSGEEAALGTITTALNLPSDVSVNVANSPGYIFSQIFTQIISNIFFGLGADSDAAKHIGVETDPLNTAAIAVSAVGTIISDVISFETPTGGGNLGGQTLIVENQVTSWHTSAATQNANAQTAALQNFDVMSAISNQIGNGTLAVSSVAEDQALNAGLAQFQIGTWQALAPQAWIIDSSYLALGGSGAIGEFLNSYGLQNYPYAYVTVDNNPPGCCGAVTYGVWAGIANSVNINETQLPVAQAAIQQLLSLGVNIDDVLGQRNGWQNIPSNNVCTNFCSVPADTTPTPPPPPVIGAPATLTILSGGQETAQTYTCGNSSVSILTQSTPVYSVFPEPISVQVQDANGNGVPNATIQVKGVGLDPTTITALTDVNGYASVSLMANGVVQSTYVATLQVTSPARDTTYPACSVAAKYDLENAPGPTGGTVPAGIQVSANMAGGSGPATARTFTLTLGDKTGSSSAMTINSLTLQASGATCNPTLTTMMPAVMTGPNSSDQFTANVTFNASSCKGAVPAFTVTVNATSTITLTDGTSYMVPATGTIASFKP